MRSAHSLNAFQPRTWARVVSGVTWAEYGLSEAGQVVTKSTRGPLIVWAGAGGQGEDLRPAKEKPPMPSPLDIEAVRLNMSPYYPFTRGDWPHLVKRLYGAKRIGRSFFDCEASPHEAYYSSLFGEGISRLINAVGNFNVLSSLRNRTSRLPAGVAENQKREMMNLLIKPFTSKLDWLGLTAVVKALCARASDSIGRHLIYHIIILLERAIYRAHVTRRVKPPNRRTRAPRPLYARPRPPTCPLAPPL